jgi:hypothetical protein
MKQKRKAVQIVLEEIDHMMEEHKSDKEDNLSSFSFNTENSLDSCDQQETR